MGIVASPRGLPELNVDAEKQRLEQALAAPNAAGQVQVEWLTQASWSSVHERLLREQWHVLHFIGHGDYDPERGEGRIALVRDAGRADWVDAASFLDPYPQVAPSQVLSHTPRVIPDVSMEWYWCDRKLGYVRGQHHLARSLDAQLAALKVAQVWRLIGCSPTKLSGSARTIRPGLLAMLDYALNRRPRRYCRRLPRSTASAGSSRSHAELGDRRITLWGLKK